MNDKELLELAAKANGTNGEYVENAPIDGEYRTGFYDRLTERCWNPLVDDGDALRLAVKLKMNIEINEADDGHWLISLVKGRYFADQESGDNPYAAARRAIVRAAACIGASECRT